MTPSKQTTDAYVISYGKTAMERTDRVNMP